MSQNLSYFFKIEILNNQKGLLKNHFIKFKIA